MELAELGLISFYIADCKYLAYLPDVLQKPMDAKEPPNKATYHMKSLPKLWNKDIELCLICGFVILGRKNITPLHEIIPLSKTGSLGEGIKTPAPIFVMRVRCLLDHTCLKT